MSLQMPPSTITPDPREGGPLAFDPEGATGWAPGFVEDITLVPWGAQDPGGARRAAGLFDGSGAFLPEGHCHRYLGGPITVAPDEPWPDPVERLEGNWLFGGLFYGHFGHFLCETTSRLWATEKLGDLDGILFFPKQRLTHERRQYRHQLGFFEKLGLSHLEIRAPQHPVTVERLALPPPAFGIGEMIAGRPEYRDFMRGRLGAEIAPDGPADLYVSRTRLPSKRGSVLLESRIEELMEAAGYTVFHPQEHDLATQIARWKAARRIVSLDGSALHLAAMLVPDGAHVAILNRGPSHNIEDYLLQFRHFAGIDALRIDAVSGFFHRAGRRVVKRETHAMLDFPLIGAALAEAGFLPDMTGWTAPSDADLALAAAEVEDRIGQPLARYEI
ncbi:glycosyltransferase family 61 protein [Roseibacterium sp. SDUM158016]|uniref:glycosyltransferase family 61 protein n=1 Tax=Roseicyclus sediminis TaxID=2980997 RepID=UPI0021D2D2E9|nr:glycosyltransferase family 61 protein [Roseibacterium sp. SDUM158016]MCU4653694.1 glycosyltransferase family 61 protein [Roseibacterium sp. SDUM158016]